MRLTKRDLSRFDDAIKKEWLVPNGLGGYASGTVLGVSTRKYHGLQVAALHPPGERTVCLANLDEEILTDGGVYRLGANEFRDVIYPEGFQFLKEFSLSPFPKYVYDIGNVEVSKTIFMPHVKNLSIVSYRIQNRSNSPAACTITPLVTCRHFHLVVDRQNFPLKFTQRLSGEREVQLDFESPTASLAIRATDGKFHSSPNWVDKLFYREEAARGESSVDDSYQPGNFEIKVLPHGASEFSILSAAGTSIQQSSEILNKAGSWTADALHLHIQELQRQTELLDKFYMMHDSVAASNWLSWICLAADSFIVRGFGDGTSVIAGYPWFETWGRDTFVSLPGLLLVTNKFAESQKVLLGFNRFCTLGLIPNFLSDLSLAPSCNTVDATMWYVNAVLQYLKYTGDFDFVRSQLWGSLKEIIENHLVGTSFGIRVDEDGLLAHGPRLTWMDAEIDGNPVTPRAGKAVEIQALWYNALRVVELLANKFDESKLAESYAMLADKAKASFARKFWNIDRRCLFDVLALSGPDASIRSNQVIAASLDFAILDKEKSEQMFNVVTRELLTPMGLRTLEPGDPMYKGIYAGNRKTRDQAYHNGCVWPWLMGPYVSAFLKIKGISRDNLEYCAKKLLEPFFASQVSEAGLGSISEIFDGDAPHTPRGCVSQAWSVAEPLRAYLEDALQVRPPFEKQVLSAQGYS